MYTNITVLCFFSIDLQWQHLQVTLKVCHAVVDEVSQKHVLMHQLYAEVFRFSEPGLT